MRVESRDAVQHHYFDRLITEEQGKAIAEIDRVMHAVFDLGPNADPDDVRKLYSMFKPGDPTELEYVTIEKAA